SRIPKSYPRLDNGTSVGAPSGGKGNCGRRWAPGTKSDRGLKAIGKGYFRLFCRGGFFPRRRGNPRSAALCLAARIAAALGLQPVVSGDALLGGFSGIC